MIELTPYIMLLMLSKQMLKWEIWVICQIQSVSVAVSPPQLLLDLIFCVILESGRQGGTQLGPRSHVLKLQFFLEGFLAPSSGARPTEVCKSGSRLTLNQSFRKYVALNPPLLNFLLVPPWLSCSLQHSLSYFSCSALPFL